MTRQEIGITVPYRKVTEEKGCKQCAEWEKVCDQHLRHIEKLKRRVKKLEAELEGRKV